MKTEIRQAYIDATTGKIVHAHNLINIIEPISISALVLGIICIFMFYYVTLSNSVYTDDEVNKRVDEEIKFYMKFGLCFMLIWGVTHWYIVRFLT